MKAICQRCNKEDYYWNISQAEINIGSIIHWKIQLCGNCTKILERIILAAAIKRDDSLEKEILGDPSV
jgi:hypothetical protein